MNQSEVKKKEKSKSKLLFIFLFFLFFTISFSLISADWWNPITWFGGSNDIGILGDSSQLDSASIQTKQGWEVISKSGTEAQLTFWRSGTDKKVELGWIPPDNNCDGWVDRYLYHENGIRILDDKNKEIKLKCESAKCDGQNCYHISLTNAQAINIDEYIKLGNNSIVTEYINESRILYDFDVGNVSLKLINTDYPENINNITTKIINDSIKFGGYDNLAVNDTELHNYQYVLNSTNPIRRFRNGIEVHEGATSNLKGEKHLFDFEDVCGRSFNPTNVSYQECVINQTNPLCDDENNLPEECNICENKTRIEYTKANCEFILNEKSAIISFISNRDIDPSTTWFNSSYTYQKQINISNTNVDSDLTNFPVLVKFSGDSDIEENALASGNDIRFALDNGTEIPYEKEFFNGSDGYFWVKVTNVSSSAVTSIYIYYGNKTATAGLDGEDATNVWDDDYVMVQHMNDITTSTTKDSTSNQNNGTKTSANNPLQAVGKVGYGQDISADRVRVEYDASLYCPTLMTISFWAQSDITNYASNAYVLSMYDYGGGNRMWSGRVESTGDDWELGSSSNGVNYIFFSTGVRVTTDWEYISFKINNTFADAYFYKNGTYVKEDLSNYVYTDQGSFLTIGGLQADNYFDGMVDEARVSCSFKGDAWTKFEYWNMQSSDNELTFGAEETGAVSDNPPVSTLVSPPNTTIFNNTDTIKFNCSATDDNQLVNVSLYIWNSTDQFINSTTWIGTSNYTNLTHSTLADGIYNWSCLVYDNATVPQSDWADNNWTVNVSTVVADTTPPYFTDIINQTRVQNTSYAYDINASDETGLSCFATTDLPNYAINCSGFHINITALGAIGKHEFNITINDTSNNINWTLFHMNVTAVIDSVPPYFTGIENRSQLNNVTYSQDINATDGIAFANFTINWTSTFEINDSGYLINNTPLTVRTYWINVSINDTSANLNWSIIYLEVNDSFIADTTLPYFTDITNQTMRQNQTLAYDINATDSVAFSCFAVNDTTNFNINCSGYLINQTALSVGNYHLNITINDSSNNLNYTQWHLNVTAVIDSIKPKFTDIENRSQLNNVTYSQDINATDETAFANFSINWTSTFEINNSGYLINNTPLSVQTYWINVSINDTSNNINWSVIYIEINDSVVADTTPPYFTAIPNNESITYEESLGVDFNATDETAFGNYSVNDTRFVINNSGWLNDTGILGVGNYSINVTINDTSNNINWTIFNLNITRKTSTNCGLFVFPASTVTYPTANQYQTINPGDTGDDDITLHLYRNGTEVSNPDNTILGVGYYLYLGNMTGGQNWTDKANCGGSGFTVNQGTGVVNGFINGTQDNFTATDGTSNQNIYLNATVTAPCVGDGNITVNGTSYISGTLPLFNITNLSIGYYNITFNYDGNINCSADTEIYWVNITAGADITLPYFTDIENQTMLANETLTYDINATDETAFSCFAVNDTTNFNVNCSGYLINQTALSVGNYHLNITINDSSNNLNYTQWHLNVTAVIDSELPYFTTIPANSSLEYNVDSLDVNFVATDNIALDNYTVNDTTNFQMNSTGGLFNLTKLAVGTYDLNITINDTSNNVNWTRYQVNVSDTLPPTITQIENISIRLNETVASDINATDWSAVNCFSVNDTTNFNINCSGYLTNTTALSLGTYNLNITTNDTYNNNASNLMHINVTAVIDSVPPYFIDITNQTMRINQTLAYDINATDETAFSCFAVNDTTNFNVNCSGYLINQTALPVGTYHLNITINDTSNNVNYTQWHLNVTAVIDSVPPYFTDITNQKMRQNSTLTYDMDATDDVEFDCFAVNDTTNFNINCSGYLINQTALGLGGHYLNITINDSSNNLNWSLWHVNVTAVIDSAPPYFTTIPNNETLEFNVDSLDTNFVATDLIAFDNFTVNDTTNFQMNSTGGLFNLTKLTIGTYDLNITINDTSNNINWTRYQVNVSDTLPPHILQMVNVSYLQNAVEAVNLNASDWSPLGNFTVNDTTNFQINASGYLANITALALANYTLNITVNDTSNNINWSLMQFNVTTVPIADITLPYFTDITNQTMLANETLGYDINATDAVGFSCFAVNDTTNFNINCSGYITNITALPIATYHLNITINDTSNNVNWTSWHLNVTAVIDSAPPVFSNLANQTQQGNQSFSFDLDATDNVAVDQFTLNQTTNFTINSSTGVITNVTHLAAINIYWLNVTVNDTSNNIGWGVFFINITGVPASKCAGNYTYLNIPLSNNRIYVRLCYILEFR